MSTIAFAQQMNAREETPTDRVAGAKTTKTGTKDYLVILAGLVPAEVLAAHAFVLSATTRSSDDGKTTVISEPTTLKWSFWGLIALSVLLYVSVHVKNWDKWDYVRVAIPPLAFVGWAMLGRATAFDAVAGELSEGARQVIPVFLAIGLGVLAKMMVKKADDKPAATVAPTAGGEPGRAAPAVG